MLFCSFDAAISAGGDPNSDDGDGSRDNDDAIIDDNSAEDGTEAFFPPEPIDSGHRVVKVVLKEIKGWISKEKRPQISQDDESFFLQMLKTDVNQKSEC